MDWLGYRYHCMILRLIVLMMLGILAAGAGEELMPLSEVRAGMRGEWRTVVEGTEIRSYELEIIGVARNFVGPQRAVILAKALDDEHVRSGPVAGMSGSPVYIDGRLVGAYAYGFAWPKDQALIGITPIDQMLEVLEFDPQEDPYGPVPPRYPGDGALTVGGEELSHQSANDWRLSDGDPAAGGRSLKIEGTLQPLPTPLFVSGVSTKVLRVFAAEFERLGLDVMQAPVGSAAAGFSAELQPGSAVAGVLMGGDFNFAAVGTVTWRDGGQILAFGHPFMSSGALALPMAEAEVLTVVQTLPRSFKLANVGDVVGTIYQDRLTAVAGQVGRNTPTTPVTFNLAGPMGEDRVFRGDMFQHRDLSPLLGAIALLQSLTQTMEASEEQTVYVKIALNVAGYDPVVLERVGTGPSGAIFMAMEFMHNLRQILGNPFEFPSLESIDVEVQLKDSWELTGLRSISDMSGEIRAGGRATYNVTLFNLLGEPTTHQVSVPIPSGVEGENLTLFFGDARAADVLDLGSGRANYTSLADILDEMRQRRGNNSLYVKLLREAPGLRIEGQSLLDLPPSVIGLLNSPRTRVNRQAVAQVTVWETSIDVPGVFTGSYTIPLSVRQ